MIEKIHESELEISEVHFQKSGLLQKNEELKRKMESMEHSFRKKEYDSSKKYEN